MTWLASKLVGNVGLYVAAALLAVVASLSAALWFVYDDWQDEVRAHATTTANLATKTTELERAAKASETAKDTIKELESKLESANRENVRVKEEGAAAVAAAQRQARQALNELGAFREVFGNKSQSCAEALANMEAACPELTDY